MTVAVTGADGFLGWHVRCALYRSGITATSITRSTFSDPDALCAALEGVSTVVHAAGVNRASSDAEVASGNVDLADKLIGALREAPSPVTVVYANSSQSEHGGAYGESKAKAADLLASYASATDGALVDLVLPHLFGEFGRPFYNSAVITFAHQLAVGDEPALTGDAELELLHAQDVANEILPSIDGAPSSRQRLTGRRIDVADALSLLRRHRERYIDEWTVPAFADRFELQMFNMLRASLYRAGFYPRLLENHRDERGAFAEICRADALGQTSFSTSLLEVTRGEHYHVDKIERFAVVQGQARIRIRRLLTDETVTYDVSGDAPAIVDMPPLCTHNIANTGDGVLGTMFWSGDHFDPGHPDTYTELVGDAAPAIAASRP